MNIEITKDSGNKLAGSIIIGTAVVCIFYSNLWPAAILFIVGITLLTMPEKKKDEVKPDAEKD
jgi:hypothetical protein